MSRVSSCDALLQHRGGRASYGLAVQSSMCIFKDHWLALQWFMHICLPCPPGGCLGHGCVSPGD